MSTYSGDSMYRPDVFAKNDSLDGRFPVMAVLNADCQLSKSDYEAPYSDLPIHGNFPPRNFTL